MIEKKQHFGLFLQSWMETIMTIVKNINIGSNNPNQSEITTIVLLGKTAAGE